jgi:hypothetical protein
VKLSQAFEMLKSAHVLSKKSSLKAFGDICFFEPEREKALVFELLQNTTQIVDSDSM